MEITEELIDSLTREETMRLFYSMSKSNTVHLDYYNQMVNGFDIKFQLRPRAAYPNQVKMPVVSVMMWHRTRRHEENIKDNWKWENSVTKNSWDDFERELIVIMRDRKLDCILSE